MDRFPLARFLRWEVLASLVRAPGLMATVAFTTLAALVYAAPNRGGLLAAASIVGSLAGTPIAASLQRRLAPKPLLVGQIVAAGAAWLTLAAAVAWRWDWSVWVVLAGVAGFAMSGTGGLIRSTLPSALPKAHLARASTLDALMLDLIICVAPLLVSISALAGATAVAIGVAAVVGASLVAVGRMRLRRDSPVSPSPAGAGVNRSIVIWTGFSIAMGAALAAVEAGAVGLTADLGYGYGRAWVIFTILTIASLAGGLLDVPISPRLGLHTRLPTYSVIFAAGLLLVGTRISLSIILLGHVLIGLPTAALLGLRSNRFDHEPETHRAGALTWTMAGQSAGFALGAAALAPLGQPRTLVIFTVALALTTIAALRSSPARTD